MTLFNEELERFCAWYAPTFATECHLSDIYMDVYVYGVAITPGTLFSTDDRISVRGVGDACIESEHRQISFHAIWLTTC